MRAIAGAAIVLLLAATACSGSGSNDEEVGDRLAAAKESFDDADFIGFELTSQDLPDGVTALEGASGTGTHAPAFTGEIHVQRGLSFSAPIVAVDGAVYAKLPFVDWSTIDPADYGAPDPAALMDEQTGLSSLLVRTDDAKVDGSQRSGSSVLTRITGTLAGKDVHALFPSAALEPFTVEFLLTDDDDLRSVSMTGPFYGDHDDGSYAIDFDLAADPVDISAPA